MLTSKLFKAIMLLLPIALISQPAGADNRTKRTPKRRGTVIIIRGAFTVFSLGMNELGDKLAEYGLDVNVVADISARRATSKLKAEFQRNENPGPIIFIGHSRGAELGPKQARYLNQYDIPVKLVIMVDAVHQTSIPKNVERCVNLYHDGTLGLVHGVPAQPESRRTKMLNVDIDRLRSRDRGGSINHFNIDSSPWIHDLIISQVLKACPSASSPSKSRIARRSSNPVRQNDTQITVRRHSSSGLVYPTRIVTGLWSTPGRFLAGQSFSRQNRNNRPHQSGGRTRSSTPPTQNPEPPATKNNAQDNSKPLWSLGSDIQIHGPFNTHTARRPESAPDINNAEQPEINSTEQPEIAQEEGAEDPEPTAEQSEPAPKAPAGPRSSEKTDPDGRKSSSSSVENSSAKEHRPRPSDPEPDEKTESPHENDSRKKIPPVQVKLSG